MNIIRRLENNAGVVRQKAFTFTEVLICLSIYALLLSGIFVCFRAEPPASAAARDMDHLEIWLNSAFASADRWKSSFTLRIYPFAASDARHYMLLNWLDGTASCAEKFTADKRVRWRLNQGAVTVIYRCETHTVTPAFTIEAIDADTSKSTGEKLTVSLRGLVSRKRRGS